MPAGRYDFTCEKGASFSYELTWEDENGQPINLTGYKARMHVKASYDASEASVVFDSEAGGITLGGSTGKINLALDPLTTEGIPALNPTGAPPVSNYVYDLELEAASGAVTRLLQGRFKVVEEVTR